MTHTVVFCACDMVTNCPEACEGISILTVSTLKTTSNILVVLLGDTFEFTDLPMELTSENLVTKLIPAELTCQANMS